MQRGPLPSAGSDSAWEAPSPNGPGSATRAQAASVHEAPARWTTSSVGALSSAPRRKFTPYRFEGPFAPAPLVPLSADRVLPLHVSAFGVELSPPAVAAASMAAHGEYDPPGVPHPLQLHHHEHPHHQGTVDERQAAEGAGAAAEMPDAHQDARRMSGQGMQQHQGYSQDQGMQQYAGERSGSRAGNSQSGSAHAPEEHAGDGGHDGQQYGGHYPTSSSAYPYPAYSGAAPAHPLYARPPPLSTQPSGAPYPPSGYAPTPSSSSGSRPSSSYDATGSHGGYGGPPPPLQHPAYSGRGGSASGLPPSFSQPLPPMSLAPDGPPASSMRFAPQTGPLPSISYTHPPPFSAQQQQQQHHQQAQYPDSHSAPALPPGESAYGQVQVHYRAQVTYHQPAGPGYSHATFAHPAYSRASSPPNPPPPSLSINTSFARPSTSQVAPLDGTPTSAQARQTSPWAGPPPPASLSLGELARRRRSATDAITLSQMQGSMSEHARAVREEEERRRASVAGPLGGSSSSMGTGTGIGPGGGRRSVDYATEAPSGLVGPASAAHSPEFAHPYGRRSPHLRFAPPPPAGALSARERRASGERGGAVSSVEEEYEQDDEDERGAPAGSRRASHTRTASGSRGGTPVSAGPAGASRRASAASSVGGAKRRRTSAADAQDEEEDGVDDGSGRRDAASKKFICPHPSCGRAFARNFNLMSHIKSHQGIREFKCPECNKLFSRKHDCTRHCIAIHHYDKDGQAPAGKAPVYVAQEILPVGVMVERAKERQRAAIDAAAAAPGPNAPLFSGTRPLVLKPPLLSTGAEPVLLHPPPSAHAPPLSATPSSASSASTPSLPTPIDGRAPAPFSLHLPPPHHSQHPAYPPPPPPAQPLYADSGHGGAPHPDFAPPPPPHALRHPYDER